MNRFGGVAVMAGREDIAHALEQLPLGGRRAPSTVPTGDNTQSLRLDLLHSRSPRCNILPFEQAIAMP
jgi:hypothetical protein